MVLLVLYESPIGYGLFQLKEFDQVNTTVAKVTQEVRDFDSFSKIAHIKAFSNFSSSNEALESIQCGLTGKAPEALIAFLTEKFPLKKINKVKLGVADNKLAGSINEQLQIQTVTSSVILELMRGFRVHLLDFLKNEEFTSSDLRQSQLGLGHLFSRNKIALDVNRQDKPIIQAVGLLELLDKDINTFAMRVKEWYSWHFPQMAKIIQDNKAYVNLVLVIGNRDISTVTLEQIEEVVGDGDIAFKVIEAMKGSMGQEISEFDITCVSELCNKTIGLFKYRDDMHGYLKERMEIVSPNLTSLIGESIAAKLIAHSGSLSTLAKYPASTIQILGAEKALFRALKQKTSTPKYGLLYNTTYIGRAMGPHKGKISRYLANKCAMAARLDHFLINPTNRFGERLKEQVERKLTKVGVADDEQLEKNEEIMDEIVQELKQDKLYFDSEAKFKKSQRKARKAKIQSEMEEEVEAPLKKSKKISKSQSV